MKYVKILLALVMMLAFTVPSVASANGKAWQETKHLPNTFKQGYGKYLPTFLVTAKEELIIFDNENKQKGIFKYSATGEMLEKKLYAPKDSAFLLKNPAGDIQIVYVDYAQAVVNVYDEDFQLQWSKPIAFKNVEEYEENGVYSNFVLRQFTANTFSILHIMSNPGSGPYYPTESFHFSYDGQVIARDTLDISQEVKQMFIEEDGNDYRYRMALISRDYLEQDYDVDFEFTSKELFDGYYNTSEWGNLLGESSKDYMYVYFYGEFTNRVVVVDKATQEIIYATDKALNAQAYPEKNQIIQYDENGYEIYDVAKKQVVYKQSLKNIGEYRNYYGAFMYYDENGTTYYYVDENLKLSNGYTSTGDVSRVNEQYLANVKRDVTQIVDIATGTIVGTIDKAFYQIKLDETGQYALTSVDSEDGLTLKFYKLSNTDTEMPAQNQADVSGEWKQWGNSKAVANNHTWTVSLSGVADAATVTNSNIFVVDAHGYEVSGVVVKAVGKQISVVAPANGYASGEYTLYIRDAVKNEAGKALANTKMMFEVK